MISDWYVGYKKKFSRIMRSVCVYVHVQVYEKAVLIWIDYLREINLRI